MRYEEYSIDNIEFEKLYNSFSNNNLFFNDYIEELLKCNPAKSCFFDIETTGLSPRTSSLYLIGVLYYDDNTSSLRILQWFGDTKADEKEILLSFSEFMKNFDTIIHYNGKHFDIPYVENKCRELKIPSPLSTANSIDLYLNLKRHKKLFNCENMRLTTVAALTGYKRTDIYSGLDCISIYSSYNQNRRLHNPEYKEDYKKLLLHNYEDLIETYVILPLVLFDASPEFMDFTMDKTHVVFEYKFPLFLPLSITSNNTMEEGIISYEYKENNVFIKVPIVFATLKYFFKNYKDYYYLPNEDVAIHKSVGTFVDKEFRENAKASNCYIKKEGEFIPLPLNSKKCDLDLDLYLSDCKSKISYIPVAELEKNIDCISKVLMQPSDRLS